ncbi:MAG TPA: hypothetical protein VGF30_14035 [Bacteroidia bacterium]
MRNSILISVLMICVCVFTQSNKICSKNILSAKLKTNDTLFITQSRNGLVSEKLGIIKLADGRYKTLQYKESSSEIQQDFTVPAKVYETVIKEEKALHQKSKTSCKEIAYTFKLGKKSYSINENNCDNTALDKIKAQLFLVQGK